MSTINANKLSLLDHARRVDPDGKIADIAEVLHQKNEILADMVWRPGNLTTGHRSVIRTGLPTVYFRSLNQGVPSSKSRTVQVDEPCAMIEARSEVDKDLATLEDNMSAFRLSEADAFMESMSEKMAYSMIYGDASVAPEEFTGFHKRYSDKAAANGINVIDAGGSGSDNTSILLVGWGLNTVHGIFPKGSQSGLVHEDLGEGDAFDANNNRFRALMDRYQWKCGLVVKDWRFVSRIGSIDTSDLVNKSSAADLIELMIKATHKVPSLSAARFAFYANRTVLQSLDIQARDAVKAGGQLSYEVVDGKRILTLRGIPIRTVDQITNTEAAI